MNVVVAVDAPRGDVIAAGLEREGLTVLATVAASALDACAGDRVMGLDAERVAHALAESDAVVLETTRRSLTSAVVAVCDRGGLRITPLCASPADERVAEIFGLARALPLDVEPWVLAEALTAPAGLVGTGSVAAGLGASGPAASGSVASGLGQDASAGPLPRVVAVWGPAGAPGRSTIAIELAIELARGGRRVGLVDADTHAPSIALQLGLADEGPGFAAACRQAELGGLDARELTRISIALGRTGVDVLTGLNRPSRWPELSESRVAAALGVCREWADCVVVDVAASLERDEEIVSDLDGPRRNAATLAALRAADAVVAVAAADPVGISRLLRAYPDLRATIGATPVSIIANRLRPGALGIDARGQVRRTLDRFGGIDDVWFVPADARSADAALLAARPIADVAPRSAFTLALRRFVGEALVPAPAAVPGRAPVGRLGRRRAAA